MRLLPRKPRRTSPTLGTLELEVLEIIWGGAPTTAQAVLEQLRRRRITLTTVQSTLERLTRKALITRTKDGRAYVYRPRVSREELIADLLRGVSEQIATGRMEPLLSGFLMLVDELDEKAAGDLRQQLLDRMQDES